MANVGKQAAKGAVWLVGSKLSARVVDGLLLVLLARLLTPRDFGLVALVAAIIALVEVFRDMGLGQAAVQRLSLETQQLNALFWGSLGIGCLLATTLIVAASPVSLLLGEPDTEPLLRALALTLPIQALSMVPNAILQRRMDFRRIALRGMLASAVAGAVAVSLAFSGAGPYSLVARSLVEVSVGMVTLWFFARYKPGTDARRADFRELFGFGLPIAGSRLLDALQGRADDILIGRFLGATALGTYSVAYRVYRILNDTAVSALGQVMIPAFARLQQDRQRLLSGYYTSMHYTALLATPVFVALGASAPDVVPLVFGDGWSTAVPVMQVLSLIGILNAVRYYDSALLVTIGRPGLNLRLRLFTFAITIVGFIAVIPTKSLVAFALVYAGVGWFVTTPVWIYMLHRHVNVRSGVVIFVSLKSLTFGASMYAVMSAVIALLSSAPALARVLLAIVAGTVTFFSLAYVFDRKAVMGLFAQIRNLTQRT